MKAFLIASKNTHPRKHNLIDLLTECEQQDASFLQFRVECATVDRYYKPTRYLDALPGTTPSGPPSITEASEAIAAAERIIQFVAQRV